MLIEDYLDQLFKNSDVFIDFYLETGRQHIFMACKEWQLFLNCFKDFLHYPQSHTIFLTTNDQKNFTPKNLPILPRT